MTKVLLNLFLFTFLLAHNFLFTEEKSMNDKAAKNSTIELETTEGKITIKLFCDVAPKACENFTSLAKKGYYNNVTFHRVIKDFMIQGGDPLGTGAGGESIWGKPFEDEFSPSVKFDRPGLLAMANRGPKTNGSQFFITTVPTPWLNNKHTIFGEVIGGMDIVKKIESTPTEAGNKPKTPIKILKITIKE